MKQRIFLAALSAAVALVAAQGFAQVPVPVQPGANPAAGATATAPARPGVNGMAVVDVAYVFKNHARFKQQMEAMKTKVELAEAEVRRDQQAMKDMMEKAKQFAPGSPEYKNMEAELLKKQGDLNLKVSLQKKQFMEDEGKIYFSVSGEIDLIVKRIAEQYGIVMVLRFNGDPIDSSDRNDILRGINKPIVFYHPHMDITPYVLRALNPAGPVATQPGMQPR